MRKPTVRTISVGATCLLVGVVLASGSGVANAAGNALINVFVTNDAAHPVPVSGSVNVGNTVPVNGTVNVGNTVPVNGTVNVGNTVPVNGTVDVGNTVPSEPFSSGCHSDGDGAAQTSCSVDVPTGRRVVIETISVYEDLPLGQDALEGEVCFGVTTDDCIHLNLPLAGSVSTRAHFAETAQVRVYTQPGHDITVYVARSSFDGLGYVRLFVSGYLI